MNTGPGVTALLVVVPGTSSLTRTGVPAAAVNTGVSGSVAGSFTVLENAWENP